MTSGIFWIHGRTNVAGISRFGEVDDIQGFANLTAAHFVAKCHTVNSPQTPISAACTWDNILSVITQDLWPQVRIAKKTDLKTDSFAMFEGSSFVTTER